MSIMITLALSTFAQLSPTPTPDPCPGASMSPGPCHHIEGFAIVCQQPDCTSRYATLYYYSDGDEREMTVWSDGVVFHEDDPETPLALRQAHGRWLRTCTQHWPRRYTLLGGMPPGDFDLAVASVMPRRPGVPMTTLDVLVWRGLGADSYLTRQAAQDCLARAGVTAIRPCLWGLESRDAEVRHRCRLVLDEIRNGPLD